MNKFVIYEIVTQKIINLLETGVIPWEIPWKTANGMPRNLVTQRPYRGINFWLLLCRKDPLPFFLTFEQAKSLGGTIRKGEKSTMVVFWKLLKHEDITEEEKVIPFLRYYNVFNISQIDGIDEKKIPTTEAFDHDFSPIEEAESLINHWQDRPLIMKEGGSAFYDPLSDAVSIPNPRTFFNDHRYYSTLFHELVHSTGHNKRLGRHEKIKDHKFGSQDYSQEELVAEMGAAYLCGLTGIEQETIQNNASYIKSWIRTFKDDPKVLIMASAQAQRAVDYILETQPNHQSIE
jgi:antirestriction protein ArdC